MHAIASVIVNFIAAPLNWILVLFFLYLYARSGILKKRLLITMILVFLLFSNGWLLNTYARFWQTAPKEIPAGTTYSCGILLGGFASPDERNAGYFNAAADRVIQTIKLYKGEHIRYILISGGNGKKDNKAFNEGAWVRGELVAMGVPDSVILYEDKSLNTADNALQSKKILDSMALPAPYILISSANHLPRASLLFERAGLKTIPFPANYVAGREKLQWKGILPSFGVMMEWKFFIKETLSYWLYKFI